MSLLADRFRVEVAFTTNPDDPAPAWVDLSSRCAINQGVNITTGRTDEFSSASPGSLALTLDNVDGALTPDNASSAFYPNVMPGKRIRVTYRDPATFGTGNLIPAESASFEGGTVGAWTAAVGTQVLANSAAQTQNGTKSMSIGWNGSSQATELVIGPLVIGRTYTVKVPVYVGGVTGSSVGLNIPTIGGPPSRSNWNNTWGSFTYTFAATANTHRIQLNTIGSTTRTDYVDAVQLDEGTTAGAFTTTAPVISYRADGYVEEWPVEWPSGSDQYAWSRITASDLLAKLGNSQPLRSVITETVMLDAPTFYYQLGEADGAPSASDLMGSSWVLKPQQIGASGGSITFGQGTGPPTDGQSAPAFAPASVSSGAVLTGSVTALGNVFGDTALECAFNCSTVAVQTIIEGADTMGTRQTRIGIDGTGHLTGQYIDGWNSTVPVSITSSTIVTDGLTHEAALLLTYSSGTVTATLLLDGVSVGTGSYSWGFAPPVLRLTVGGSAGRLFTGTISHVSGYTGTVPTVAHFLTHRVAMRDGFAGESTDARIARVCSWIGLPAARQVLDAGLTTNVGHVECTGMSPADYLRLMESTEIGFLYVDGQGRLVFRNRAWTYTPTSPDVTVDARMVDPVVRPSKSKQGLANDVTVTRSAGGSARAFDQASIDAYGEATATPTSAAATDADLMDSASWRLALGKTPRTRVPNMALDAYTDPTYSPAIAVMALAAHLRVSGLPAQAPPAMTDQVVQGWSEAITESDWTITANTTPFVPAVMPVLILDDATYGALDSFALAY